MREDCLGARLLEGGKDFRGDFTSEQGRGELEDGGFRGHTFSMIFKIYVLSDSPARVERDGGDNSLGM